MEHPTLISSDGSVQKLDHLWNNVRESRRQTQNVDFYGCRSKDMAPSVHASYGNQGDCEELKTITDV